VGGGDPVSLNAALEQLAAIAGRPLDVTRAGRESGDVLHTAADTGRAREELGFAPAIGFAAGLAAEFEWVLARTARKPLLAAVSGRR
jgi:nucleoside-diphosphate-sugar epimerase